MYVDSFFCLYQGASWGHFHVRKCAFAPCSFLTGLQLHVALEFAVYGVYCLCCYQLFQMLGLVSLLSF